MKEEWGHYIVSRMHLPPDLIGARSVLKVTCPHCHKWMIVKLTWIKGQYRFRPCTHCREVSMVPVELPKR